MFCALYTAYYHSILVKVVIVALQCNNTVTRRARDRGKKVLMETCMLLTTSVFLCESLRHFRYDDVKNCNICPMHFFA